MKTLKNVILSSILMLLVTSCATMVQFPVSSTVPAADITVSKVKDKNNNFRISISAANLASAERLSPARSTYVVWITTKQDGLKNVGQLKNKNAKKSTLKAVSSFEPLEVFITAEYEGNVSFPKGIEITRIRF